MPRPTAATSSSHYSPRCCSILRILNNRIVATLRLPRNDSAQKCKRRGRRCCASAPSLCLAEELEVGPVLLAVGEPDHELPAPCPVPLCLPDVGVEVRGSVVGEPARVDGNRLLHGVYGVKRVAGYRPAP